MAKHFFATFLVASLFLLPMTACPPISGVVFLAPGHWSFQLSDSAIPVSIVLLEGGSTADPPGGAPPGSTTFAGTLTWMQVDEVFTMTQTIGGGTVVFVYTGNVLAQTYMEGSYEQTVGGSMSGIWNASYVP